MLFLESENIEAALESEHELSWLEATLRGDDGSDVPICLAGTCCLVIFIGSGAMLCFLRRAFSAYTGLSFDDDDDIVIII